MFTYLYFHLSIYIYIKSEYQLWKTLDSYGII